MSEIKNYTLLYSGKNITQSDKDILQRITIPELYDMIRFPEESFVNKIAQLRNMRQIATERYHQQKKSLPYFIGAEFHQNLRSMINFLEISSFVIDIDYLSSQQINPEQLKELLKSDENLLLAFVSPGGDGLKLIYQLESPLGHCKYFSDFYKAFCRQLINDFQLVGCVDEQTCDVTRVCFLSHDENAYFNPNAKKINPEIYFPNISQQVGTSSDLFENDIFKKDNLPEKELEKSSISVEVYRKIKEKLNPGSVKHKVKKNYYVPPQLEWIDELLPEKIRDMKPILLDGFIPVQYGKKYLFKAGTDQAEILVYFGKNGYSIVRSGKKGTHQELTEICYSLLEELIYEDLPRINRLTFDL